MFERGFDCPQHAVQVLSHIAIPEANDSISLAVQEARALFVIWGLKRVMRAVELDHQPCGVGEKIDEIRPNRHLPKLCPSELPTQDLPQDALLRRCRLAQGPRPRDRTGLEVVTLHRRCTTMRWPPRAPTPNTTIPRKKPKSYQPPLLGTE